MSRRQASDNPQTVVDKLKKTLIFMALLLTFSFGAGLMAYGSGIGHSYIVAQNAEQATKNLTVEKADQNRKVKTSYDATKTESINATQLWNARKYTPSAIGRMSMPSINIHNPLFLGFGAHNENLSYGVVTVVQGRTMGAQNNYVLAGHYMGNYGPAILDNLHYAKPGDMIYVTDMHNIFAYRTKYIDLGVKPTQIEIEDNIPGKTIITLITCSDFDIHKYGFGQHRTIVQGQLIGVLPANKKNLEETELSDKIVTKKVHYKKYKTVSVPGKKAKKILVSTPVRTEAQTKWYQKITFNQTVTVFLSVIGIVFLVGTAKIWLKK